jgi:hypothetical protein
MTLPLHPATDASPLPFPLGERCGRCHRYLTRGSRAKRSLSGRWRHDACQQVAEPDKAAFAELAEALMRSNPWPRLLSLQSQLADSERQLAALETRAASIPEQRPAGSTRDREQQLRDRIDSLRAAIVKERAWKAGRLAAEWADGQ